MKETLTHKGFTGSVEQEEDGTLYGAVKGISALILYDGVDMIDLEKRFHESVDAHLESCAEGGWDPYNTAQFKTPLARPLKRA